MISSSIGQPITQSIAQAIGGAGVGGDTSTLISEVGTFTSPISTTGNQVVSLDSAIWDGAAPKCVIFWGSVDSEGVTAHSVLSFGVGISAASQAVVGAVSQGTIGTSVADRRHDNTAVIALLTIGGTVFEAADYVDDATGNQFTINWSTNSASEYIYNYLAIGGPDVQAYLDEITSPASAVSVAYTGVGFQSDCLIGFCCIDDNVPPASRIYSELGVSAYAGGVTCRVAVESADTLGISRCRRTLDSRFLGGVSNYTDHDSADVTSLDSDGYTLDWTAANSGQKYNWVLCLKGAEAKIITGDQPATNTTVTRSPGFAPKAALTLTAMAPTSASVQSDARIGIGAWDSSNNMAFSGAVDEDGQEVTDADRIQDSNEHIKHIDHTQTVVGSCSLSASGSTVTETWSDCDGTQREHSTLYLG